MLIVGLTKTTLLDYPKRVACTIFTGGCNLYCPYCHNVRFIAPPFDTQLPPEEIFQFLQKRRTQLQGVCISGGEPTLHADLPEFIREIKALGYKVKLDTNGTNYPMLKSLVCDELLDYIAMDIKLPVADYKAFMNEPFDNLLDVQNNLKLSIDFIMHSGVEYEFRSTLAKGLHTKEMIAAMSQDIYGAKAYYLQNYNPQDFCDFKPFEAHELEELRQVSGQILSHVVLR